MVQMTAITLMIMMAVLGFIAGFIIGYGWGKAKNDEQKADE